MAAVESLKCLVIGGRTDSSGAAQNDVDQEEFRMFPAALMSQGYTHQLLTQAPNTNAWNVRQNTGTDMNVKVGSGTSKVDGHFLLGSVAGQGAYLVRLDTTGLVVAVPATDPTNPARYGVFLFVDDVAYSGDTSRAYAGVKCLRGTPAGSPVTPTADTHWSASQLLWEFQLPANATAVTNAILDGTSPAGIDRRVPTQPINGNKVTRYTRTTAALFAPSSLGSIVWDTVLTAGTTWGSPTATLTVPAGYQGLWLVNVTTRWASAPTTVSEVFVTGGVTYEMFNQTAATNMVGTAVVYLAAGATLTIQLTQVSGGAINLNTAALDLIQLSSG